MIYRILKEPKNSIDGAKWSDTKWVFDDKLGDVNEYLLTLQKDGVSYAAEAINDKE